MNHSCRILTLVSILAGSMFACGGGRVDPGTDAADPVVDADPGNPVDAMPPPPGFQVLVARDWVIPAGDEIYRCTRVTVTRDTYIAGFHAIAPQGTHHTVLSVSDSPTAADGDYNCSAGSIAHSLLYASGVGTDDFHLPEGVAIRLRAGQQLDLNLHLFNVSDGSMSGNSGIAIREIVEADVVDLAEVVFGGSYNIFLASMPGEEQTVNGGCTFEEDATVFALWPHMHQLGRHTVVRHESGTGTATLLDSSFAFTEQQYHPIAPVSVSAGDRLDIDCVYINDTGRTVTFGDSSTQEMCFVGIYRYPASDTNIFACTGT